MAVPFKRILCPIDFDGNAAGALALAAQLARHEDARVMLFHVIAYLPPPAGVPVELDLYKVKAEEAKGRLHDLARRHLEGIDHVVSTHLGEPISAILQAEKQLSADLVVIPTHGRRGISRVLLGSVAEAVLRQTSCPVMVVRARHADREMVGHWMTEAPTTAAPDEKLASVQSRMKQGKFRSMPVVEEGKLIGIISDRDIQKHIGELDRIETRSAMTTSVLTVTPRTPAKDAARLLREHKVGGLPVLDEEQLVGIVTTSDLLGALIESD